MGEAPRPQIVLVTGSSSGFGLLIASRLAARGDIVYATMRDISRGESLSSEARKKGGKERIHVLPLDVTKPETIRNAVTEIASKHGVIDAVVNNAGFGMAGFFEDLSPEDYQQQFDVNFFGILNVTREVVPIMRPRRKGKIINISSMAAFSGTPCFSAYCSSKWALEGFSECLYMELKPFGIDVSLVEPGSYRTKIFEDNARVAKRFNSPGSPYFETSRHLRQWVLDSVKENTRDPDEVARVVERLIARDNPPFRNVVGLGQRLRAFGVRHIPFKLYAWLVNELLLSGETNA